MIEVEFEDESWTRALPDAAAIVERAAAASLLLTHEMEEGDRPKGGGGGEPEAGRAPLAPSVTRSAARAASPVVFATGEESELTVLLTDDATVRDLNARFRGKDAATNVLAFPAPETARPHLGDVALAYGVCAGEAEAQGKTLADHLMHLTAHGLLHLLGYDHQTEAEAGEMEALERRILHGLGSPDPYGAEGPPDAHAR
jgi:probable rRNA maturation factor